jgi:predicted GNAT family acetyltransferase
MSSSLALRRFADADSLLDVAAGFLGETAGASNLTTGILGSLRVDPAPPVDLYLGAVVDGGPDARGPEARDSEARDLDPAAATELGAIRLVALRTPPLNLVLSACVEPSAVDLLLDDLIAAGTALPGVIGPTDVAGRFAREWALRSGETAVLVRHERSHRLRRLIPIPSERVPRGRARPATAADHDLVTRWLVAFHAEAVPDAPRREMEPDARRWLTLHGRTLWLWEVDDRVVSFAGLNLTGGSIVRVGPVYTPPAERRRGFAAAVTSAATAVGIADGADCYLFTDLANPTANAIYARLGYEGVADLDEWRFGRG